MKPCARPKSKNYFSISKSEHIHGWIDFVVNGLMPFSYIEKDVIRNHIKNEPFSRNTVMKYLSLLTQCGERKICNMLPNRFAIVFGGWSSGITHYLCVFAKFPSRKNRGYESRLLALSPLEDETSLSADEHIEFLSYVLGLYTKSWENIVCLIADNVNTNKSISTKTKKPMIGFASYRFNFAVRNILHQEDELITKINTIMLELKNLVLSAEPMKCTPLRAKTRNITRWNSTHEMLGRYVELRNYFSLLHSDELATINLKPSDDERVDDLLHYIEPLESVTKVLLSDDTKVSDARILFDAVIDNFPCTINRLSPYATIVHDPTFESAVLKIQRGNIGGLSVDEKLAVSSLSIQRNVRSERSDDRLSFVHRALKMQELEDESNLSGYMDTRFLVPTSNLCERLFSRVGYALSDRRRRITPANLEVQLFLHLNSDFWGRTDINEIVNS